MQSKLHLVTAHVGSSGKFVRQLALYIGNWEEEFSFLSREEVQALVGGDPVNPGIEPGVAPKRVQVVVHLNKDLLGEIIGIIVINHHLANQPIDSLLVLTHQEVEPVALRLRVLNLLKKIVVFQLVKFQT